VLDGQAHQTAGFEAVAPSRLHFLFFSFFGHHGKGSFSLPTKKKKENLRAARPILDVNNDELCLSPHAGK
jgi:hypothetical protein